MTGLDWMGIVIFAVIFLLNYWIYHLIATRVLPAVSEARRQARVERERTLKKARLTTMLASTFRGIVVGLHIIGWTAIAAIDNSSPILIWMGLSLLANAFVSWQARSHRVWVEI